MELGGVNGVLQPRVHQEGDHRPPEGPDPVDQDVLGHGVTLAPGKQDGGQKWVEHPAGHAHDWQDDQAHQDSHDEDRVDGFVVSLQKRQSKALETKLKYP